MTECTQTSFEFEGHFSRQVVARFDGGQQTSDAGALLLRETDRRLKLLSREPLRNISGGGSNPGVRGTERLSDVRRPQKDPASARGGQYKRLINSPTWPRLMARRWR